MAMTARDIIVMAMTELKTLPSGDEPDAKELKYGLDMLSGMLRSWQTFTALWRKASGTLVLDADTASIELPAYIRTVTAARLITGTQERRLNIWDEDEFDGIPVKTTGGTPLTVSVARQRDAAVLNVWPVPTVETSFKLEYERKVDAITDPAATIDVPEDWEECVWTNLALRISNSFGSAADVTPELVNRAGTLLTALRDDDRPTSYFMGPEYA